MGSNYYTGNPCTMWTPSEKTCLELGYENDPSTNLSGYGASENICTFTSSIYTQFEAPSSKGKTGNKTGKYGPVINRGPDYAPKINPT